MKFSYQLIAFILLVLVIYACKDGVTSTLLYNNGLIGTWIKRDYLNQKMIYLKSDSLDKNEYGFTFFANGKMIERKNSGWCGTPPISFSNFDGSWNTVNDSTLEINVGYWGGMEDYSIIISTLTADSLIYHK